jgi:hypothetical protein
MSPVATPAKYPYSRKCLKQTCCPEWKRRYHKLQAAEQLAPSPIDFIFIELLCATRECTLDQQLDFAQQEQSHLAQHNDNF